MSRDFAGELADLIALPRDQSRSLPAHFYTSSDLLALEEERLFRQEWVCLGHEGELAKPGDYFTTTLAGEPLIVSRDKSGEVSVLSNVCRHRGNIVAEGQGNRKLHVCQYHGWSYEPSGKLRAAPHMEGRADFDPKACALPQFPVEIWKGFIFTNLDGNAEPLLPRLAAVDAVVKNYHQEDRFLNYITEDRWATNWKCLFENFMEGYHLSITHKKTLHPITPTKLCRKMVTSEAHTGFHAVYDPSYPPRGPFHADLTEDERQNSAMIGIYPNLLIGMATNFTLIMIIRPAGTGQVDIRWGATGLSPDNEGQPAKDYVALCHAFNAEDKEKLEALHTAMGSRYFPGGPLAPEDLEGTIRDFQEYLCRKLS